MLQQHQLFGGVYCERNRTHIESDSEIFPFFGLGFYTLPHHSNPFSGEMHVIRKPGSAPKSNTFQSRAVVIFALGESLGVKQILIISPSALMDEYEWKWRK